MLFDTQTIVPASSSSLAVVRHRATVDEIVDQLHGSPQRADHEHRHEHDRDRAKLSARDG